MSELQKIACHRSHRKRLWTRPNLYSRRLAFLVVVVFVVMTGCRSGSTDSETNLAGRDGVQTAATASDSPPGWASEAIWYQIFVERFRNGDPSNDPRIEDIRGSDPLEYPVDWQPIRWTQDWYERAGWERNTGRDFYFTAQLRRYGGDLQGVLDKLDYLEDLGVTAVYFNPLNDAPSLHKYDARNYRHIDRNFGPDPDGDAQLIAGEDPADPATWRWTSADSLFLVVVDAMHARGIRVIVDYSWNHTGITFWAWRDLLEHQAGSDYTGWYRVERFDDPTTSENEFSYRGWAGVRTLPELSKTGVPDDYDGGPVEGNLNDGAKDHILAVTRRWMDPDGDGDPSDGVDGFRLDVAEKIPLGFWRDYRRFVKSINPDAYLVGEIWWEQWPDRMMDPKPYLGDIFDAVMNYRWYMPTRSFLAAAQPPLSASEYVAHLDSVESGIRPAHLRAMMNVAATHDSPRLSTSLYNPGRYKYGVGARDNPDYKVERPDDRTRSIQRMLLVQQFTYYGAPHIWYGDEVGMWGADDPDNRKPMVWADLEYDPEDELHHGGKRSADPVHPDSTLHSFYKRIGEMRSTRAKLFVEGSIRYVLADDERGLLGYERALGDDLVLVYFNRSDQLHEIELPAAALQVVVASEPLDHREDDGRLVLPARSAVVLAKR